MKAFVSWSGGKESVLSFYRTRQNPEVEIAYFLSMVSEDGQRSRSHGINSDLMQKQALMAGVPLIRQRCSWTTYEAEFKKAILSLKEKGVEAGIFGDIDLQEHRDWVEKICKEMEIKPILPLWQEARKTLLEEFTAAGFKAIVVAVQADFLGNEWLGRIVNEKFITDLQIRKNVDLCGENGEYHTFVFDGPVFQDQVDFSVGRKVLKENRWFLKLYP
ncbi:MAG: diphthine--ammonia ligase [Candidatus Omnitrophota bacterium]|nr:diphthine--ammonia ligase [Candidatus Omnitrophota bacterium]